MLIVSYSSQVNKNGESCFFGNAGWNFVAATMSASNRCWAVEAATNIRLLYRNKCWAVESETNVGQLRQQQLLGCCKEINYGLLHSNKY